jgi:voltage-gated potassium channel
MDTGRPPLARANVGREMARAGVRVFGILVAFFVLPFGKNWLLSSLLLILVLVGLFPFAIRRFHRVLRSDHPIIDAVSALLITLVTLVVTFGAAYYLLATRDPASMNGLTTKLDALYYETTILSTVGFGDITAVSQGARAVVTVNIVMNMLYLGTTLRLLTWAAQKRRQEHESAGPSL